MDPEDRKRIEGLIDELRGNNDFDEGRAKVQRDELVKTEERITRNSQRIITLCCLLK